MQPNLAKCTACRTEFVRGEKGATSNNCRHCTYNIKVHGQPSVCKFCNLMAAFVDSKCQRCTAYEKKYGAPQTCEQCKMKCAFDRSEKTKSKLDGKTLCWLCALAYKRVLEKAKERHERKKQGLRSNPNSYDQLDKLDKSENLENTGSNSRDKISPFDNANNSQSSKTPQKDSKSLLNLTVGEKSTPPSFASSFDFLREHKEEKSNDSGEVTQKIEEGRQEGEHKHRHHHHHHHHKKHHHHRRSHSPRSPSKRPRLENTDSNGMDGLTPTRTSMLATEKSPVDPNSSEHIIAINRLQEQLDNLKKQLSMKDQQLLEKEKKMTEIKAAQYESEKSFRTKLTELAKQNLDAVETLQAKNRELEKKNRDLTKQVASLSKGKKSSMLSNSQSNSQNNSPSLSS